MTPPSAQGAFEDLGPRTSPAGTVECPGTCTSAMSFTTVFARVISSASLTLLIACGREPDLPPLPPAQLDPSQAEALKRMNAAGANTFAGWTWRYEFGAGCRMRVIKRYEERPIPVVYYVLTDHYVEIVPYPGTGFGVKAYPRAKAGSADLFDARGESQAAAFVKDVEQVLTACGRPEAVPG